MSSAEAHMRNALCRHPWPVFFEWMGEEWSLSLQSAAVVPRPGRFQVEADWGGARVLLRADSAWVEQLAQAVLAGVQVSTLPVSVVLPILEAAFAGASGQVELFSRRRLVIQGAGTSELDLAGLAGCHWVLRGASAETSGEIWLDELGVQLLPGFLGESEEPVPAAAWAGLCLPVSFCVGWVDLDWEALSGLGPRDVVLLDECWLQDREGLFVEVSPGLGFRAGLLDRSIRVTRALGAIMRDDEDDYGGQGSLADIPVRLTFDLGQRMLSLAELQRLEPGYTFELGRDVRHAVTVRANGMAIGEGELVEVDGHIAVSVLSLRPPEKPVFAGRPATVFPATAERPAAAAARFGGGVPPGITAGLIQEAGEQEAGQDGLDEESDIDLDGGDDDAAAAAILDDEDDEGYADEDEEDEDYDEDEDEDEIDDDDDLDAYEDDEEGEEGDDVSCDDEDDAGRVREGAAPPARAGRGREKVPEHPQAPRRKHRPDDGD